MLLLLLLPPPMLLDKRSCLSRMYIVANEA